MRPIPAFADLGYAVGSLAVATMLASKIMSLPIYPGITKEQQDRAVATHAKVLDDSVHSPLASPS